MTTITNIPKKMIILGSVLVCLLLISVAAFIDHNNTHPVAEHTSTAKDSSQEDSSGAAKDDSSKSASHSGSVAGTVDASHTSNAPQDKQDTVPNNPACKRLTLAAARAVLGDGAKYTTPSDPAIPAPSGTELSACAYNDGTDTIQLTLRTAKNSLGASQNATVFGSEKPSGVTDVPGYGQSAYWNPQTNQLNILGNNNWYIITSSQNTQASAEVAAKPLVEGF